MVRAEIRLVDEICKINGIAVEDCAGMRETKESYSQFMNTWVTQTYKWKASHPMPISFSCAVSAVVQCHTRRQAEQHNEEKVSGNRAASGNVVPAVIVCSCVCHYN